MDSHFREHDVKLSNLRALSHHMRTNLLPTLEHELRDLQSSLSEAGRYAGPLIALSNPPSTRHAAGPVPQLIPPTPVRSSKDPSLAIPPTPIVATTTSRHTTVMSTPLHNSQRPVPSKISESVRRAVAAKGARGWIGREHSLATGSAESTKIGRNQPPSHVSTANPLTTIPDEDRHLSPDSHYKSSSLVGVALSPVDDGIEYSVNQSSRQTEIFSPIGDASSEGATSPQVRRRNDRESNECD